jgi:hypothetical protein
MGQPSPDSNSQLPIYLSFGTAGISSTQPTNQESYDQNGMMTAVMVIKVLSIGDNVKKAELRKSKFEDSDSNDHLDISMFKDVTSRAVALVALGSYVEDLGVRDGCDEDMPEYKLAKDFVLPPEYVMEQGWARRPSIGMIYGAKYIEHYKPC